MRCGGQEHFYLEPAACIVCPLENDEISTVVSTQCVDKSQRLIASALGIPQSKVVAKSKRIGGGFGGKETRAAFLNVAAAVAAYHLRKPVRLVLDRHVDMAITGQRHAFYGKYKVGCTADGKIRALSIALYNNAGNSLDLSQAILDRALFHADSSYAIPNMQVTGQCCKTNLPSNTAFRGFGGPQTVLLAEMWLEKLADAAGMVPEALRQINLVDEGYVTHYGQVLERCQARACWEEVCAGGGLEARRVAVDAFNTENRWRKRGLAVTPVKFGISFTATFMNQAGSLIHIYRDGTVLVNHGGIEMGQGLHTKMCQVAATALGIPTSQVFVAETSSDKVANASPSAASASSDLYGMAVLLAAQQLAERLQPVREQLGPDVPFLKVVESAYFQQIDLSAHGFYQTPDIYMDWDQASLGGDVNPQMPFNYFCYGAAMSEVEIDCLTVKPPTNPTQAVNHDTPSSRILSCCYWIGRVTWHCGGLTYAWTLARVSTPPLTSGRCVLVHAYHFHVTPAGSALICWCGCWRRSRGGSSKVWAGWRLRSSSGETRHTSGYGRATSLLAGRELTRRDTPTTVVQRLGQTRAASNEQRHTARL